MKKINPRFFISFLALIILITTLSSCSGRSKSAVPDELFGVLRIKVESDSPKRYLIHFLKEGLGVSNAYASVGSGNETGFVSFTSDHDGTLDVDLQKQFDKFSKIMTKSSDLNVVISSEDDPFIRNPLSDLRKIRLYVVEGKEKEPVIMCAETEVTVKASNENKGSGISLAFPNASFIIKLDLSESGMEILDDTKFEVLLYDNSDPEGKIKTGRICRGFNYWEAPFYKSEIASKEMTLVIREFYSGKEMEYDLSPMTFSFNEQGLCSAGSVIRVTIAAQSEHQM